MQGNQSELLSACFARPMVFWTTRGASERTAFLAILATFGSERLAIRITGRYGQFLDSGEAGAKVSELLDHLLLHPF